MNLWLAIEDDLQALDEAMKDLRASTRKYSHAEVEYQKAKAKRALEMKADGVPVTLIQMTIKGDDEVSPFLLARECAQSEFDADKEQVNVLKKRIDTNREQMAREWNYQGKVQ